jgi:transcriptional regulator with XRE-family HTH domain
MGYIVLAMTFPTTKEVAAHLAAASQGQGLSPQQLSDLTGISVRQVKAKLKGERPLTVEDLHRLATALGTTPGQVYTALA